MRTTLSFSPTGYNPMMSVSTDKGKGLEVPIFQVNVFSYQDEHRPVVKGISYASDRLAGKSFEFDLARSVRTVSGLSPEPDEQVFVEVIPHRDGFKEGILCIREDIANTAVGTPRKDIFKEGSPTQFVARILADCTIGALDNLPGEMTLAHSHAETRQLLDRLKAAGELVVSSETLAELDSSSAAHRAVMEELETCQKFWLEASIDDILRRCSNGGSEV